MVAFAWALAAFFAARAVEAAVDAEAAARAFVADLVAHHYDAVVARYDEAMAKALPKAKTVETWEALEKQAGPFQTVRAARKAHAGKFDVVFVTCGFQRGDVDVKVVLAEDGKVSGLFFLPAGSSVKWSAPQYVRADGFDEREVTVGALKLPGTLTVPRGKGPFPAVVLVHGSGPNDRDESIGGYKLFKDLAWGLASHGIVVLRYDKRTRVAKVSGRYTVREEVIDDARAAVALLAGDAAVDGKRIFVAGHSLGAILGPRIADGEPRIAGIALLAGSSRPLDVVIVEQFKYLDPEHASLAEATARQITDKALAPDTVVDFVGVKIPGSYFLDLRGYDPLATVVKLKIPILVAQGGRDYQVRAASDFEGWKRALAGHANASFKLYPALNHHFVAGSGESRPEEYAKAGHADEALVRDLVAFVTR
jgi:dienelactone hydrolase